MQATAAAKAWFGTKLLDKKQIYAIFFMETAWTIQEVIKENSENLLKVSKEFPR